MISNLQYNPSNFNHTEVFFIGDVRDVIYSRANKIFKLPGLLNGFGACGTERPESLGEGIIFRGHLSSTPPDSTAGTVVIAGVPGHANYTPFFIGFNGAPSLSCKLISENGVTINRLYQDIFLKLGEIDLHEKFSYIFLEVVGLFKPSDIFDRALQKPVNDANILTTLPENAQDFFKSRVIYKDLLERQVSCDQLFPLLMIGAGYIQNPDSEDQDFFSKVAFYQPPGVEAANKTRDESFPDVLTHNHALGWREERMPVERHTSALRGSLLKRGENVMTDPSVDGLLEFEPDYLVHLDDWSIIKAANIRVFLAPIEKFRIIPSPTTAAT